jgi:hypothetical protein
MSEKREYDHLIDEVNRDLGIGLDGMYADFANAVARRAVREDRLKILEICKGRKTARSAFEVDVLVQQIRLYVIQG